MKKTPYKSGPPKRKKLKKFPATQIITELPENFFAIFKNIAKKGGPVYPLLFSIYYERVITV